MIDGDTARPQPTGGQPDLRIGAPEREAAESVLRVHLEDERLDATEFEGRVAACRQATTRSQLLRAFVDLPPPHPDLTEFDPAEADDEDDMPPPLLVAGCSTLLLGLPVAIVVGIVYGAWWSLAVPVVLLIAMMYAEHLRTSGRDRANP